MYELFISRRRYTVRDIGKPSTSDKRETSGANMRTNMNPGLNKRGMKFAHVNVVTLLSHFADVDMLLEKTAVDVFAVTESRLDCTISDGQGKGSGNEVAFLGLLTQLDYSLSISMRHATEISSSSSNC